MMPQKLNSLLREAGVLALLALLFYLAVALLTYSPQDPGPTHTGSGRDILNLGGAVGAWFAGAMLTVFGRVAYLVLLLLCAFGWRMRAQRELRARNPWSRGLPTFGFIIAIFGACGLENLYWPIPPAPDALTAGGIIGDSIAGGLLAALGALGVTVLFLAMLFTGITLFLHLSWFALMDRLGYRFFVLARWAKAQAEKRADQRAGSRERKRRTATVKKFRDEMTQRKPPKIAPKIAPPAPSARQVAESQTNLFAGVAGAGAGELPPLSLLEAPSAASSGYSRDELETMSQLLVKKLKDFNVDVAVEAVQPGPVITRFEVDPAPGIKASQIVGLARDLARSLSVESVRVVDNIAGKTVIGLEIPNQNRETVRLVEGLSSRAYEASASPLTLVLGKDIAGNPSIAVLDKMPHLLIAGTTGSGKSVCINALILSILYKATPEQVRMIMVDPKFLELSVYDGIPHLLAPVVTDMEKAANALRWCIGEMDRRFRLMAALNVRSIAGYNKQVSAAIDKGAPLLDPTAQPADGDGDDSAPQTLQTLPYIVVVVDELADLMMVAGKKIEAIIIRIAQRARAAGIHLVLATQRPSVDVVTGLIKANVPTRIAFQVSSRADSRTVIDQMGAEQLLGQGDMLYMPPGSSTTQRVHGSFVSDEEVADVVAHLKSAGAPVYLEQVTATPSAGSGGGSSSGDGGGGDEGGESDALYDEAVRFVTQSRRASISSLQRALRVGYNRAARMIETMEEAGIVSANDGGKREVLAPPPPED